MTHSERYRMKAVDCCLRAESARDERHRTLFLHMEECWRALAARADFTEDDCEVDGDSRELLAREDGVTSIVRPMR